MDIGLRFHVPGHKGRMPQGFSAADVFGLDTTELPETDNLYAPTAGIKKTQERAARLYGAVESFLLTNGSTAGVLAAMIACLREGDTALIARNCHASVVSGLILTGANPVFINPEDTKNGFFGCISPNTIKEAFEKHKNIRAVIVTSPTYEGCVSDTAAISLIARDNGAFMITDAAHGAHLPFSDAFAPFPAHGDIAIAGLHKTLPVFGQCALLNLYTPRLSRAVLSALAMVQTSSPSFLFVSAMDALFSGLANGAFPFDAYAESLKETRKALSSLRNISLYKSGDISKFVFVFKKECARFFGQKLKTDFSITPEAVYSGYALAVSSIADTRADLMGLAEAIRVLDNGMSAYPAAAPAALPPYSCAPPVLNPRDAYFAPYEYADADECEGRTAARVVTVCPPGVPVLIPGETITKQIADYIKIITPAAGLSLKRARGNMENGVAVVIRNSD